MDFKRLKGGELSQVIREVNAAMGLPAIDDRVVEDVMAELDLLRPVAYKNQHPVTLLHGNHVSPANKWEVCNASSAIQNLRADPLCQRLAANGGKLEEVFDDVDKTVLDHCSHA